MRLLKFFSIPDLDFSMSYKEGWIKLKNLSNFDKYMTMFWLIGPFIYLIERDPADLWLTILGLIFICRCIVKKEWYWVNQLWFKSALLFWFICLLTSLSGADPLFSFQQSFVWIRFPLYAVAAQVWLGKDRDLRILMLISLFIGMLIMCFILISEVLMSPYLATIYSQELPWIENKRLSWPYNDLVPGSYLAKVCLPVVLILVVIIVNQPNKKGFISLIISTFAMIVSVLTGERTNLLIKLCSSFFALFSFKPNLKIILILILVQLFALITLFTFNSDLKSRFTKDIFSQLNIQKEHNEFWGALRGGIHQAIKTPLNGIGPSGTRNTCKKLDSDEIKWLPGNNYCGNHPHNFYIQLFAETGIVGFLSGCFMMISIFVTCFKSRKFLPNCPIAATSYIIPLALFFPLQQFGSFFGQWGNLFIWFAIGYAISNHQK